MVLISGGPRGLCWIADRHDKPREDTDDHLLLVVFFSFRAQVRESLIDSVSVGLDRRTVRMWVIAHTGVVAQGGVKNARTK